MQQAPDFTFCRCSELLQSSLLQCGCSDNASTLLLGSQAELVAPSMLLAFSNALRDMVAAWTSTHAGLALAVQCS